MFFSRTINETTLLKEAKESGCKIVYGDRMLFWQGVLKFEVYTGVEPPIEVMVRTNHEAILSSDGAHQVALEDGDSVGVRMSDGTTCFVRVRPRHRSESIVGCRRWHVRGHQLGADRLGPRERFLVGHERHRRDTARHVAARAALLEDREDVVVVGVLRRDRLVRFAALDGDGDDREHDRRACDGAPDAHGCFGNADSISCTAAAKRV